MDRISFHKGAMATTPSCSLAGWSISPCSRGSPSSLLSFDGTEVTSTGRRFYNYSVDGGKLYGLGANGQISRTTDLRRWTDITTLAPESARSLVVIDGAIYVGTTDSRICKFVNRPELHVLRLARIAVPPTAAVFRSRSSSYSPAMSATSRVAE